MTNYVATSGGALTSQNLEVSLAMTPWQAEMTEDETELLMQIAEGEDEALKHPLCEVFIHMKDVYIGSKFRFLGLLLYCCYLASFTSLVLLSHSKWSQEMITAPSIRSILHNASLLASSIFCAIMVVREIFFGFLF